MELNFSCIGQYGLILIGLVTYQYMDQMILFSLVWNQAYHSIILLYQAYQVVSRPIMKCTTLSTWYCYRLFFFLFFLSVIITIKSIIYIWFCLYIFFIFEYHYVYSCMIFIVIVYIMSLVVLMSYCIDDHIIKH